MSRFNSCPFKVCIIGLKSSFSFLLVYTLASGVWVGGPFWNPPHSQVLLIMSISVCLWYNNATMAVGHTLLVRGLVLTSTPHAHKWLYMPPQHPGTRRDFLPCFSYISYCLSIIMTVADHLINEPSHLSVDTATQ